MTALSAPTGHIERGNYLRFFHEACGESLDGDDSGVFPYHCTCGVWQYDVDANDWRLKSPTGSNRLTKEEVIVLEARLFEDPNYNQQCVGEAVNVALGMLAAAYELDGDALNERAGASIEQSVVLLRKGRGAA